MKWIIIPLKSIKPRCVARSEGRLLILNFDSKDIEDVFHEFYVSANDCSHSFAKGCSVWITAVVSTETDRKVSPWRRRPPRRAPPRRRRQCCGSMAWCSSHSSSPPSLFWWISWCRYRVAMRCARRTFRTLIVWTLFLRVEVSFERRLSGRWMNKNDNMIWYE